MHINVLVDSVMFLGNVIINSPHSRRLQSLSDGWVHSASFGLPPGMLARQPAGKPIMELLQCPAEAGGGTTHISYPKRRTVWITALKNVQGILASAPSRLIIHGIRAHLFLAFLRLTTTAGQSSSVANKRWPRYLNDPTLARGWP